MSTETLRPNEPGTYAALSRSGAATNWECVDEATADNDSTYVYSTTTTIFGGKRDTYGLQDHSAGSGMINSLTIKAVCRNTSLSWPGYLKFVLRVSGADTIDASWTELTNSYAEYSQAYATNPATGLAWTWAEVDAIEAGIVLAAPNELASRCTQLWVEVDYTEGGSPVTVAPDPAAANASGVAPEVVAGAISITPAAANAQASGLAPNVIDGVSLTISPEPASANALTVNPTWITGPITYTPAAAEALAAAVAPNVWVPGTPVVDFSLAARSTGLTVGERAGVWLLSHWLLEDEGGNWLFEDGSGILLGRGDEGAKFNLQDRSTALTVEEKEDA